MKFGRKFRLYPTAYEQKRLNTWFAVRRRSWNFIHERVLATKADNEGRYNDKFVNDAMRALTLERKQEGNIWMQDVIRDVVDYVSLRYKRSWKTFFRKLESGEVAKAKAQYIERRKAAGQPVEFKKLDSYCQPQFQARSATESFQIRGKNCHIKFPEKGERYGFLTIAAGRARESFRMKFRAHREQDFLKVITVTISRQGEQFHVSFSVEDDREKPDPVKAPLIGIEANIRGFKVDGEAGELIEHPHPGERYAKSMARLQRKLARQKKGSKNFRKTVLKINRMHQRISNIREDFLHKTSRRLVDTLPGIAIERLGLQDLARKPVPKLEGNGFAHNGRDQQRRLTRMMRDVGHGRFRELLKYKAEWAGKPYEEVESTANTNRTCSSCGHVNEFVSLRHVQWQCESCGALHEKYANSAAVVSQKAAKKNK